VKKEEFAVEGPARGFHPHPGKEVGVLTSRDCRFFLGTGSEKEQEEE
jgi:hypothetical protein